MIGLSLMATVLCHAIIYKYPKYDKPTPHEMWAAFRGAFLAMLTPLFVIGNIVGGFVTPTESAVIAAGYALILGMFVYRNVKIKDLGHILYDTARFASISLFAIGTASAFGFMLTFFKVPNLIVSSMTAADMGLVGTGLVTPPYGLCLLISAAIGGLNVVQVMRDVVIILIPMLAILLLIILFPQISLWLPQALMPGGFR